MASRLLRRSLRHYSTFLSRNYSSVLDDPPRLVYHRDRNCPMRSQKNSSALKSPLPLPQTKAETNRKAERFISRAIAFYGQAGMFDQALNAFNFSHEKLNVTPSVKSLNGLLTAAIITYNPHEVTRIYKDFPKMYSIKPNADTYNLVMGYFVDTGSTTSIFSIFVDMSVYRVKPNATTFNKAFLGFLEENKFEEIEKLVYLMENRYGLTPYPMSYSVRIKGLCKLKMFDEARRVIGLKAQTGLKPSVEDFYPLISGVCEAGDVGLARLYFHHMKTDVGIPRCDSFYFLVDSLCKIGEFEHAFDDAMDMIRVGCVPTLTTMKKLVNGLVCVSKVDDAKKLVEKIKDKFSENGDKWGELEESLPQES
ncbi:putative pentatricopeptide [Medicago truncatula]|uniref:Membrane-associated salt-inducible protein n=1 Tax=Medicago truncatula TaxID=3880 RepID=A0A072U8V1_MEDTR|nr:pentatricopeptide repeat-containing protein At1g61870, mitochondrial [Medicago truncatula]KEH26219.1 membrane-associated salt-inducible protein [Medicago truncatula]RHN51445.1 putative pentatricopeptide [Medicago truncatula]